VRIYVLITYLLTYEAEPFLRRCQLYSYSKTSQYFMEPEDSLPLPPGKNPFAVNKYYIRALHWSLS
jgi:hypothetical protein